MSNTEIIIENLCCGRRTYCNIIIVGCVLWMCLSLYAVVFYGDNQHIYDQLTDNIEFPFPTDPDILKTDRLHEISKRSDTFSNVSEEEMTRKEKSDKSIKNAHLFQTVDKSSPGEMGKPVFLSGELKRKAKDTFGIHQFNLVASDIVSLNRQLPDYRMQSCKPLNYPEDLPDVSVLIVFHNEAWSTLIRTIHSIINRTPKHLLHEFILVDDGSELHHLKKPLEEYVAMLPVKVTLLRTGERAGLVKGRLMGTAVAKGKVIVFMDSHCECTEGWLEPLLFEIYKDRKTVTWPLIGFIDEEDFGITPRPKQNNGGFDWRLHFLWDIDTEPVTEQPVRSPTFSGGIYAIDREYFYELGAYDEDMQIWGFENTEISLRIWMCGGRILKVPCSHVMHIFRSKTAYTWPGGLLEIISHNSQRVANVWLDDHAKFLTKFCPDIAYLPYGNITKRLQLREKLQCKSFQWYIKNVYPTLMPLIPLEGQIFGEVRNEATDRCLQLPRSLLRKESIVETGNCVQTTPRSFNPRFIYTPKKQLVNLLNTCVEIVNNRIIFDKCEKGRAKWDYDQRTLEFRYTTHPTYCLDVRSKMFTGNQVSVLPCDGSKYQQWTIKEP